MLPSGALPDHAPQGFPVTPDLSLKDFLLLLPTFDGTELLQAEAWIRVTEARFDAYPRFKAFQASLALERVVGAAKAKVGQMLDEDWEAVKARVLVCYPPSIERATIVAKINDKSRYSLPLVHDRLALAVKDQKALGSAFNSMILGALGATVPGEVLASSDFVPTEDFDAMIEKLRKKASDAQQRGRKVDAWASGRATRVFAAMPAPTTAPVAQTMAGPRPGGAGKAYVAGGQRVSRYQRLRRSNEELQRTIAELQAKVAERDQSPFP
jgi:hypothetical protein